MNRQLQTQKLDLLFKTANALLLGTLGILVVWLGARNVLAGTFSVGMLVAFIAYKDQFLRRVSELTNRVVDLQMLHLHAERLADIALAAPEPQDPQRSLGDAAPDRKRAVSIEARDLCFRYGPNDAWVLDEVNFRIEAGESVAIAGPSGCGKTTLLKLLCGLLQPTRGAILIDGEPLSRVGTERYRAMIGVVMQDDQLFAGSIADNISFFAARPDQARIKEGLPVGPAPAREDEKRAFGQVDAGAAPLAGFGVLDLAVGPDAMLLGVVERGRAFCEAVFGHGPLPRGFRLHRLCVGEVVEARQRPPARRRPDVRPPSPDQHDPDQQHQRPQDAMPQHLAWRHADQQL